MDVSSSGLSALRTRAAQRLGLLLSVLGAVCLSVAFASKTLQMLLTTVGALSLGVGLVVLIYEFLLARDIERFSKQNLGQVLNAIGNFDSSLAHRMKLTKEYSRVGLVEVCEDCTNFDYGPILLESRRLVVVLNDGRTWASVHRDRLRRRFTDPAKATTFFLCHPDSAMLAVLARKGSHNAQTIQSRIAETVRLLEDIKQPSTVLEILGHHLFNPHALVLGDESAVLAPYFFSRGGRTVPAMRFQDLGGPCYFRDIVEDVERLRMDAQEISSLAGCRRLPESSFRSGSDDM